MEVRIIKTPLKSQGRDSRIERKEAPTHPRHPYQTIQIDAESVARGYMPEHEAVLASTKLLTADQSEEFVFVAPEELGIYQG